MQSLREQIQNLKAITRHPPQRSDPQPPTSTLTETGPTQDSQSVFPPCCSLGSCSSTLRRCPLTASVAVLLMCCRSCLCCRPAVAGPLLPLPCCNACVLPGPRSTVLLYRSRSSPAPPNRLSVSITFPGFSYSHCSPAASYLDCLSFMFFLCFSSLFEA
ncbi:hypothetical protein SKAU_G00244190 [Synaphobranchus kaupii]|uniref:Uncharacterized protein n=1 Tax=Synaphobranchus kaupii TaxID=118154 RepID=A0A9Q1F1J9_SYNKA|nr:hypothetical protein SKAU_G00244190 [Synaphobranchus kaupii]